MRRTIFIITLLSIILLVGCTEKKPTSKTYIIQEPQYKTFTIEHTSGLSELKELQKNTAKRRATHRETERINEKIDDCIDKVTKNWRRIIDDKLIIGFDEQEDFDMRWRLRLALLNDEKIC